MSESEQSVIIELKDALKDVERERHQLFLEKDKLSAILESIGDGVFVVDANLNILLINQIAADLAGVNKEEALGTFYQKILHFEYESDGSLNESFIKNTIALRKNQKMLHPTVLVKKDGIKIPVADSSAPLFNAGGEIIGVVVVFRDVTEERALDKAKSGFIAIASHQLRTPLTAIRWYSEMLIKDSDRFNETERDFINEIHGGVERLYQMINLLLSISRVEGEQAKAVAVPTDLAVLTAEVSLELMPMVNEKKITFNVTPPENRLIVSLEPVAFRQVISNIFTNAVRYVNNNGNIEVHWEMNKEKTAVVYSVKDDGIGIPENQRERIFQKFFRAQNAIQKIPDGSGLGLSLVKELVESWGGKIWFDTSEVKGTTFFFTIPTKNNAV